MKTLSKIILINGDNVTPYPNQEMIETDKTVELWEPIKAGRMRIKRWSKSRHILYTIPIDPESLPRPKGTFHVLINENRTRLIGTDLKDFLAYLSQVKNNHWTLEHILRKRYFFTKTTAGKRHYLSPQFLSCHWNTLPEPKTAT